MNYTQTSDNLHILDSYLISKHEFEDILFDAAAEYTKQNGEAPDWYSKRSLYSLKGEWAVHNLLYNLGLWKSRTRDVDLNYPCDKPEWIYSFLGTLAWILIK